MADGCKERSDQAKHYKPSTVAGGVDRSGQVRLVHFRSPPTDGRGQVSSGQVRHCWTSPVVAEAWSGETLLVWGEVR